MALFTTNTGSQVENLNGSNRTGVSISPQIVIRVGSNAVGAIQSISFRENRNISQIDEVGTDGHIDSVPTKSTDIEGSCERVRYDRLRIAEAFSRGFLHAKSQRIGFDIDIYDRWGNDDSQVIVTTIRNVWIKGIDYSYKADNFINVDTMSWVGEDISSTIQGNNAATGGTRGLILQTDSLGIERQTDRGLRRGALDAAGLLTSVFG